MVEWKDTKETKWKDTEGVEFKVGDKVILKSGGPVMTVATPSVFDLDKKRIKSNEVLCRWYNEKSGRYEARYFQIKVLELYKEPEEKPKRDMGYRT